MSALPRPSLPPGPHRDLVERLHDLHHRAGWPSLRALARETGVSHTTVSKAFSTATLPTWGTLELLVEALGLGGDTVINPSGGPLAANPIMATGLVRNAEAAGQIRDNGKHRTLGHSTSGPCLQQNLVCVLEGGK